MSGSICTAQFMIRDFTRLKETWIELNIIFTAASFDFVQNCEVFVKKCEQLNGDLSDSSKIVSFLPKHWWYYFFNWNMLLIRFCPSGALYFEFGPPVFFQKQLLNFELILGQYVINSCCRRFFLNTNIFQTMKNSKSSNDEKY